MDGFDIELRRSNRKTLSLEVTHEAKIIVRAPYRVPTAAVRQLVADKREWIAQKQAEALAREEQRRQQPSLTQEQLEELSRQAKRVLPERVAHYAGLMGVDYGRITIRSQKTRWGSCSGKGNLSFNRMLMRLPPEIRDYVVVHELCHRRQMNHSAAFWQEVARVLPDYRQRRAWLRENGAVFL
ncbi:MAG: M48 family metallopeptidase [Roseburia sp.]|nr:M48 family metallopeptidase [Roseburia sp.]